MKISIEKFHGERPSFNIHLSTREGATPFLSIKGCRIVSGPTGDFIGYPATKNASTGKYWNHVYGSAEFNQEVMNVYNASQAPRQAPPAPRKPSHDAARSMHAPRGGSGFDDFDDAF